MNARCRQDTSAELHEPYLCYPNLAVVPNLAVDAAVAVAVVPKLAVVPYPCPYPCPFRDHPWEERWVYSSVSQEDNRHNRQEVQEHLIPEASKRSVAKQQ